MHVRTKGIGTISLNTLPCYVTAVRTYVRTYVWNMNTSNKQQTPNSIFLCHNNPSTLYIFYR